ncbi:MAG: hypothetical protein IPJ00_11985 [Saprospirales bacterium]|nr:hypothetical protein [Saprospirales bacterium]
MSFGRLQLRYDWRFTSFKGNVLALTDITMNSGATAEQNAGQQWRSRADQR